MCTVVQDAAAALPPPVSPAFGDEGAVSSLIGTRPRVTGDGMCGMCWCAVGSMATTTSHGRAGTLQLTPPTASETTVASHCVGGRAADAASFPSFVAGVAAAGVADGDEPSPAARAAAGSTGAG